MRRVAILGRGGAGKSVLARRLGALTGLPVVELDTLLWQPGLDANAPRAAVHVLRNPGMVGRFTAGVRRAGGRSEQG